MFDMIAVIDWSAASSSGPRRPTKDRVWMAWWSTGQPDTLPVPEYFRTRAACLDRLHDLLRDHSGPALLAWDFPFGYPAGSGLGGGRCAAEPLSRLIEDGPDDRNNRFKVARRLNRGFGPAPGPFWGCPPKEAGPDLTMKMPDLSAFPFRPWRRAEQVARDRGLHSIQSVWKLFTTGSVGSQALTGLAAIARLNERLAGGDTPRRTLWWPFDTGWSADLDGIVHVECWPSLFDIADAPFPIRDQAQVAVTRNVILEWMADGSLRDRLAAPPDLVPADRRLVEMEEGWILGL